MTLVVMDCRLATTEERLQWLREQGYRYLAVSRERKPALDPGTVRRSQTASKHGVQLYKALSDAGTACACITPVRSASR